MLGIVVVTHGSLSDGLKDSVEVIMGTTTNMATVNLNQGDDVQKLGEKINDAIYQVNQKNGVIILVDIISASPYNQAVLVTSQLEHNLRNSVYIVGGVNLPMLLEAINLQLLNTPIEKVAEAIVKQGMDSLSMWHSSMQSEEDEDEDGF